MANAAARVIPALKRAIAAIDRIEAEEAYARPSRARSSPGPSTFKGSCRTCKRMKVKCVSIEGEPCEKCVKGGIQCELDEKSKRGRKKGVTRRSVLLDETRAALVEAVEILEGKDVNPSPIPSTSNNLPSGTSLGILPTIPAPNGIEDADLDNPLAVLAHLSLLRDGDNAMDSDHTMTDNPAEAWMSSSRAYYSDGLYEAQDDRDLVTDPVSLGIIAMSDLVRLVDLYFEHLWHWFWHLVKEIHTPHFLRETSPFLTTVVAATAAMYCPLSSAYSQALQDHAEMLASRVFSLGLKSVEIVQAYCMMAHWTAPGASWLSNRSWAMQGQAHRIAAEIRMDRPLGHMEFLQYRSKTILSPDRESALRDSRQRSWQLLLCGELNMAAQTGRLKVSGSMKLMQDLPDIHPVPDLTSKYYYLAANVDLNKLLAKWLDVSMVQTTITSRDEYRAAWSADLDQWHLRWPNLNTFIQIRSRNVRGLLLACLLRFPGPTQPVLDDCIEAAMKTVELVTSVADESILYASNFAVTIIAYGSVVLLRLVDFTSIEHAARNQLIRSQCAQVVTTLLRIAIARVNSASVASLQAARIQTLLQKVPEAPNFQFLEAETSTQNIPIEVAPGGYFDLFGSGTGHNTPTEDGYMDNLGSFSFDHFADHAGQWESLLGGYGGGF